MTISIVVYCLNFYSKIFIFLPEPTKPKPLLKAANCSETNQLGCADGTCLPGDYFCDGSVDCQDGSDEAYCDVIDDPNAATPCNTTNCKLPNCFCSKDGNNNETCFYLHVEPDLYSNLYLHNYGNSTSYRR